MHSRATIAALFAVLINVTVFVAGAAAMLAAPGDSSFAAYVLPAAMAGSLFLSPIAGWALAHLLVSRQI